jgi:hypothetical protein
VLICFEDFSNEIFYEIFEFLDTCDIYDAFYHLNDRIRQIVIQLSLPYKINLDLISKTTFQDRCQYIIIPNVYRIISLSLSNWFCINRFLLSYTLDSTFLHLESLTINEIEPEKVIPLLMNLGSLPRLFSLSLTTIDRKVQDPNTIHQLILSLPVLKYCNTTMEWLHGNFTLLNLIGKSSTIEYFVTKSEYNLDKLSILLSYMSRLVHLSCKVYLKPVIHRAWKIIILNNLTYFHLKHCQGLNLDQFEMFISNLIHQLQVLRISSTFQNGYLDSNRWKRLISTYLPRLHTFDLQHFEKLSSIDGDEYHLLIDGFNSSFWIERKWFFAHQHYQYNNYFCVFFYSIRSNRYNLLLQCKSYSSEKTLLDCNRYIFINNDSITIDLLSSRPIYSNIWSYNIFDVQLNRIIPFQQLTDLTVESNNFDINQAMEFLHLSPNIQVLALPAYSSRLLFIQNKNNNYIQHLTIREHLAFKDVQELINVFPRLKSLECIIKENDLELIIRFLLKYSIEKNDRLHLLGLQNLNPAMIHRLQEMIDHEKLAETYSIEYIFNKVYLWW